LHCLMKIFRHLPHKLSSLPLFRWPYHTFLSAFVTSDLAANGELGERQKDVRCEAEEVACVAPDREHAENGLLVVPEQRETYAPLLHREASYLMHGYVEYLSCCYRALSLGSRRKRVSCSLHPVSSLVFCVWWWNHCFFQCRYCLTGAMPS